MKNIIKAIITILTCLLTVNAYAKSKEISIDPDKAYILVQVDPFEFKLFGTNRMKMDIGFGRYDPDSNDIRGGFKAADNPVPEGEVVRTVARKKHIAKRKKARLYLLEVEPDIWTIEAAGTKSGGQFAAGATSFSLGSYHFYAKAGEITDLGVFLVSQQKSDNPDEKITAGKILASSMLFGLGGGKMEPRPLVLDIRARGEGDLEMPAYLRDYKITYPEFVYGGTFGNYGGGLVNRVDGKEGRKRTAGETAYLSMPEPMRAAREEAEKAAMIKTQEKKPKQVESEALSPEPSATAPAELSEDGS